MSLETETEGERIAQEKGGIRVSLSDIEASIVGEFYISGEDAARAGHGACTNDPDEHYASLRTLTLCLMTVRNGFTVVGVAAPVDAKNFDASYGRTLARQKCIQQLWPLMGFAKREALKNA